VKKITPYSKLAFIYDRLMDHVDYKHWAKYVLTLLEKTHYQGHNLIDLSCGTGSLLSCLKGSIGTLFGCDLSFEMIKQARRKKELNNILLFVNNVYHICLPDKSVDCALFLYDSLNYLDDEQTVIKSLQEINRILKKSGILIFDVVTEKHCLEHYNDFIENEHWEKDGYSCHSYFDIAKKVQHNEFRIILDGHTYIEKHRQKIYSINFLREILGRNSFELHGLHDGFSIKNVNVASGRIHFVCIKK
jgi:ubiquinone/menaquinone biosynthesis C-methylase UbiE